jgi:hypothetical protein
MRSLEALKPTDLLDIPYLPRKHFARACNCSESYIRKLIADGELEAVKDGDVVKMLTTPRERMESLPRKAPAVAAEAA